MNTEDITARSITLVDSKGESRIHLTAETSDGSCLIRLGSPKSGIQIDAAPDRLAGIAIHGPTMSCMVSITSEGISLRSKDGKLGVVVGMTFGRKR
jgi:hypothetical protein